jgi:hypothetical protein
MYYCLVSILEGKIRHIYGKSINRELCISMADYIGFGFHLRTKFYPYHDQLMPSAEKKPGLPMVISVNTDNESEVNDLISAGKYTIEQEYEYSTSV